MLPAIIPALSAMKPALKYSLLIGVPVVVLTISHTALYFSGKSEGKKQVRAEWDAAIGQQAAEATRQIIASNTMESQVVKERAQVQRAIEAKADQVKKEVVHHAKQNPKPLSVAVVSIYDRLISVPNETVDRVPAADPGAGTPEVPRGGLAAAPTPALPDADGTPIELTTEELAQAAVDFAEKYALLKNAYKGLSEWNDGREQIELERIKRD